MSGAEHDRASLMCHHGIHGNSLTSSRLDFTICARIKQKFFFLGGGGGANVASFFLN